MTLFKSFLGFKKAEEEKKTSSYEEAFSQGFALGFSKAWDMMLPSLYDGFDKVKEEIVRTAKLETIKNLQSSLKK